MPKATILVVDDDIGFLIALSKVFQKHGYVTAGATDARTAVEYVTSKKQHFDVVITDLSMPNINGIEFLSIVKENYPDVPVIVISAFGQPETRADMMRKGAFAYLDKPLLATEILTVVNRAFQSKRPMAQAS
jgi:DNA-binding NtrC family response regulator